ncbi:MAG TPA: hypothetical protein VFJ27_01640 [Terriglobia bacterium]|nr:hypothetical protein [Terriglobia bacterium]
MILCRSGIVDCAGAVVAVCYALYAPVAVMEGSGVRTTLKQFTLPVLVWVVSVHSHFTFRMTDNFKPKELSFGFNTSGSSPLYQC